MLRHDSTLKDSPMLHLPFGRYGAVGLLIGVVVIALLSGLLSTRQQLTPTTISSVVAAASSNTPTTRPTPTSKVTLVTLNQPPCRWRRPPLRRAEQRLLLRC